MCIRDRLTSFDGNTIISDEIGNIINIIYNGNGYSIYDWNNGRQLRSVSKGGATQMYSTMFKYNANGQRTQVDDMLSGTYSYYYLGNQLSLSLIHI